MSDDDPHDLGHRQRLRERFLKSGLAGFADYEVVELLLTLAIPRSDVKQPAKALITRFGKVNRAWGNSRSEGLPRIVNAKPRDRETDSSIDAWRRAR